MGMEARFQSLAQPLDVRAVGADDRLAAATPSRNTESRAEPKALAPPSRQRLTEFPVQNPKLGVGKIGTLTLQVIYLTHERLPPKWRFQKG